MLRGLCRQATRGSHKEEILVCSKQRAHHLAGATGGSFDVDGKGNTKTSCATTGRKHALMLHPGPDMELASLPHQKSMNFLGSGSSGHLARFISVSWRPCAATANALLCPSFMRHNGGVPRTQKCSSLACLPCMHYALHQSTETEGHAQVASLRGMLDARKTAISGLSARFTPFGMYSSLVKDTEKTNVGKEETDQSDTCARQRTSSNLNTVEGQASKGKEEGKQEDVFSQMLEMMGFLVDGDLSEAAMELRQAQQEMLVNMRRCSRALFAVGGVHLTWGGMMFFALEPPLNHAVLAEVCMSSLIICGLAYQLRQTVKPIEFFTNQEEHRKMRIIFLSRQVTRMLGAFFHRGRGIALVVSLTLMAHSLSCVRFLV